MSIDISGLNRDELLEGLWNKAPYASFFKYNGVQPPNFDLKAKTEYDNKSIDYFCGKPIKANIYSSDAVDPVYYDRDSGNGAFASVVATLRTK